MKQVPERWENQREALEFSLSHNSCMLDMEMGTGKTRVAIETAFERPDVSAVLVVCPKAVIPVWRSNLQKFAPVEDCRYVCWDRRTGSVRSKTEDLQGWLRIFRESNLDKMFIVVNYDSVWRAEMGAFLLTIGLDMVILDESHRAKAAGSKVSKYLAMLGKRVKYKMCLSGTPMANSPLDVYGQYRFLDPSIFGTNHNRFLQEYAIMGGPEMRFIVGFKNQKTLKEKFSSIAYTCKMEDVASRIKLPDYLPPVVRHVTLPARDMKIMRDLNKDFIAECGSGHVVVSNVLIKILRLQQITSGFCCTQESVIDEVVLQELNRAKEDDLMDIMCDINPAENVVVFCVFKHDLDAVARAATRIGREAYELSGRVNELDSWDESTGGVLAVQIQAGAEGVDMTKSNHAIYFSMPHSLALYNQSKARLYRPGQNRPVVFMHILAEHTIDESLFNTMMKKEDTINAIKRGTFDFGYMK